jgi:pyrroloquinoline quinone biosynthesis protein A
MSALLVKIMSDFHANQRSTQSKLQRILCTRCTDSLLSFRRNTMWTKPAATEMRFGFEVTMYVMNK